MGNLRVDYGYSHEFVTSELDRSTFLSFLPTLVDLLRDLGVSSVDVKYGYVMDAGEEGQEENRTVSIRELQHVIADGLDRGVIEWGRLSDFVVMSRCVSLGVMLCNDTDLHFGSDEKDVLTRVESLVRSKGIETFGVQSTP